MAMRKVKNRTQKEFVTEIYDEEEYVYLPLGNYLVAAPGVCGGRPTLKYTRMDARWIMMYLRNGRTIKQLAKAHGVPAAAIEEVMELETVYDYEKSYA